MLVDYLASGTGTVNPSGEPEFSFGRAYVVQSIIIYIVIEDQCLSFCAFSFGHFIVCPSSIHEFWLRLLYPETSLVPLLRSFIHEKSYLTNNLTEKRQIIILDKIMVTYFCKGFWFKIISENESAKLKV